MNGIIIDGDIYKAEIGFDPRQCDHCDLSKICEKYFGAPEDTYPCKLFSPCNKVYFKLSPESTDKPNSK